jgi:hypothetical protein
MHVTLHSLHMCSEVYVRSSSVSTLVLAAVYAYAQSSFGEFASSALLPLENSGYDDMSSGDFSSNMAMTTGTTAASTTTTTTTAAGTGTGNNSALMRLDSLDWLRSAKQTGMASPRDADVSADAASDLLAAAAAAAAESNDAVDDATTATDTAAASGGQRPAKRAKVEPQLEIDTSMVSNA